MKSCRAIAPASVGYRFNLSFRENIARAIVFTCSVKVEDSSKNKFLLGKVKASVARNFLGIYSHKTGTVKQVLTTEGCASVARNFLGALLLKKGTVK